MDRLWIKCGDCKRHQPAEITSDVSRGRPHVGQWQIRRRNFPPSKHLDEQGMFYPHPKNSTPPKGEKRTLIRRRRRLSMGAPLPHRSEARDLPLHRDVGRARCRLASGILLRETSHGTVSPPDAPENSLRHTTERTATISGWPATCTG
jgi:hypothetical protein